MDDGFISYSSSEKYDPFVQWSWLGDYYEGKMLLMLFLSSVEGTN
jgi:hypothetical protein